MPESHSMASDESAGKSLLENPLEESAGKSLLEKPLHQLTEDDIAQLTREDCRRYLKEKGMRRPSWNKSQAIQQVIMLKKLLEADSEAGSRKLPIVSHINNTAIPSVHAKISVSVEKRTTPHPIKDLNKPDSGVFSGHFAATKDKFAQPRATGTSNIGARQMTIFYSGKVNVYDDVPAEKARTIMHIASSPVEFPNEHLNDATTMQQPLHRLSKCGVSAKARQDSADVIPPTLRTASMRDNSLVLGEENTMLREETPAMEGGPSTRKASVQRYLEKRKDRFKSKRRERMTSCANMDNFNHQTGNQIPRIDTCSHPKPDNPQHLRGVVQWITIQLRMSE